MIVFSGVKKKKDVAKGAKRIVKMTKNGASGATATVKVASGVGVKNNAPILTHKNDLIHLIRPVFYPSIIRSP